MPVHEGSRLIKAHGVRPGGSWTTFDAEDLRRQCDDYVTQARRRGDELIAVAAVQAEEVRRRAFEEGRLAGEQAGFAAAKELIAARAEALADELSRQRLQTALPAIDRMIDAFGLERERWLAEWEAASIRLSAIMAEKLVRRELSRYPEWTVEIVREALQLAAGSPQITLRLHPSDLARLNEHGPEILERLSRIGETAVAPDDSIAPGGCLIETRQGTIDARIETQLARIVDELVEG